MTKTLCLPPEPDMRWNARLSKCAFEFRNESTQPSPESLAAKYNQVDVLELLQKGGKLELSLAIEHNSLDVVKYLIDVKKVNVENALHLAVNNNASKDTIEYLSKFNDINYKNNKGETPLLLAIRKNNLDNVKTIINLGGKLEKDLVFEALKSKSSEVAQYLNELSIKQKTELPNNYKLSFVTEDYNSLFNSFIKAMILSGKKELLKELDIADNLSLRQKLKPFRGTTFQAY